MTKIDEYYNKQDCPENTPSEWKDLINENFCLLSFDLSGIRRYIISPVSMVDSTKVSLIGLYIRGETDARENLVDLLLAPDENEET